MYPHAGHHPPSSLIVNEQPVNRMKFTGPVLRAGVAAVYSRADGTVVDLGRRLSFGEALSGTYRTMYEVDMSRHETHMSSGGGDLPTRDDRFSFVATVTVGWQVSAPDVVVREGVRDGGAVVSRRVLGLMRGVSRRYEITDCEKVEQEINDLHRSGPIAIREFGLTIDHISAFVTLDDGARTYLQQQVVIERERDLGRRSHNLNVEALNNEHDLERRRMDAVLNGVQGELGLIALHLRHHPDEGLQVLQLMHARQQELEQHQQARFASSDELFTKMLDAGLVQAADVEEIRRQVLQNTLSMVGGTAVPVQATPAQLPAAPPSASPPAPVPASSPVPATRPAPPVRGRGGNTAAQPAAQPTAQPAAQPAGPPAPAPDPNGVGGWRPRKGSQPGTGAG
ncbi:hypothetical protein [Actinoplanes sp. NPDC049681]|uniref:hypothetical protein n=1 Tax=Actinoplanes sp. NPDC049681 TaxID=3363905 RepID=UPI0037ADE595